MVLKDEAECWELSTLMKRGYSREDAEKIIRNYARFMGLSDERLEKLLIQ